MNVERKKQDRIETKRMKKKRGTKNACARPIHQQKYFKNALHIFI